MNKCDTTPKESEIVKAYNTVNEVLNILKIGSSDYRSDYSDRSNPYVSRAELMGIGLSALLTPDGDYSKTNMLNHVEHAGTRYSRARGIFPGDEVNDVEVHKREYHAAELRYLFVCILQDGLDASSDMVTEFYRIRTSA